MPPIGPEDYQAYDVVNFHGSSYVALIDGPNADPGSDPTQWELFGAGGSEGAQGAQGPTGAAGAQGPKGDKGDSGAQGAKGDKGDSGAQGPQGAQGVQGPQGAQGAQGPSGFTDSPSINGNLTLVNTSMASDGITIRGAILKGLTPFIHNFGIHNTFIGVNAGNFTMGGGDNTASGFLALFSDTVGINNTASGSFALAQNTTGSNNIALGFSAGVNQTTGSFNIDIGNDGLSQEGNTIRIGDGNQTRTFIAGIRGVTTGSATGVAVLIDADGQLGTMSSSRRFKDDIADMDAASSALMKLRPVTFHYKSDQSASGRTLQYGLIAEEVADVYPGLVAHSADGQVETVMYQFLPSMLLNEYQKQQRMIDAQASRIAKLERERHAQAAEIEGLKAAVAEIAELKQQTAHLAALLEQRRSDPSVARTGSRAMPSLSAGSLQR